MYKYTYNNIIGIFARRLIYFDRWLDDQHDQFSAGEYNNNNNRCYNKTMAPELKNCESNFILANQRFRLKYPSKR